jgi:hypothetical protein
MPMKQDSPIKRPERLALTLLLTFLVGACAGSAPDPGPAPAGATSGAAHASATDPAALITADDIYNRIYVLASDGMMGRDTPSPGLEAAAAYLVSEHRRMGLEGGMAGSFYQRWPYRLVGPDLEGMSLALAGSDGRYALAPVRDVAVQGATRGTLSAEVVFVGSAEGSPEPGSLEGQVAAFLVPVDAGWDAQARQRSAQQARYAESAGAVGAIHILRGLGEEEFEALAHLLATPARVMGDVVPSPRIYLREGAAGAIPGLDPLLARAENGDSFHERTGVRLTGEMPLRVHDDAHPPNVVAVIPGSDPELRDEYVVLSAHFDHVGVGSPDSRGDTIYNGADDNASGTAVLLETARAITSMGERPRRSVAFVHVSGEEKGLLGSRWFVENPPWPVEQMVANINADMVGSNAHPDTLVVIGKEYSTLGPLVDDLNDGMPELGLVTSDDLWPEQRFFYRSDQFNFMRMEIPSLFFFTGVHECYHRPCDTPDFIDAEKAASVARLLTHTVLAVANADERPEWDPAGLAEVRELTGGR